MTPEYLRVFLSLDENLPAPDSYLGSEDDESDEEVREVPDIEELRQDPDIKVVLEATEDLVTA